MPTNPTNNLGEPLSYEAPRSGISRNAFLVLLVLTLVNTFVLCGYLFGPKLGGFIGQEWSKYQQSRAAKLAAAQQAALLAAAPPPPTAAQIAAKELLAEQQAAEHERWIAAQKLATRQPILSAQQQALDYSRPAETLVYAEDPAGIAQLKAQGTVEQIGSYYGGANGTLPTVLNWQLPISIGTPACARLPWETPQNMTRGLLFMHQRCSKPDGVSRLLLVAVAAQQDYLPQDQRPHLSLDDARYANFGIRSSRTLTVHFIKPATIDADMSPGESTQLELPDSDIQADTLVTGQCRDDNNPAITVSNPRICVDYAGMVRMYAGQPDQKDESKFSIHYTLDGQAGDIIGRLSGKDTIEWSVSGPLQWKHHPDRQLLDGYEAPSPHDRRATGTPR